MMLTLYALLVNVTMHKQQSRYAVMFAEGGGWHCIYVQASAINLLQRSTIVSPVATALINFLHFILFCFCTLP